MLEEIQLGHPSVKGNLTISIKLQVHLLLPINPTLGNLPQRFIGAYMEYVQCYFMEYVQCYLPQHSTACYRKGLYDPSAYFI